MKNNKLIIILFFLSIITFSNCYKNIDIPKTNNATIVLNSGTNYVSSDVAVNAKDSLIFSYTITSNSNKGIKYVGIQKNATDISSFIVGTKDTLTGTNISTYSATKRMIADSANGIYTFRIVALDSAGLYIGSKSVTVTVNQDFYYYTLRVLQEPDTTAKTNTCFLAATTGNVYSYSTGATNSGIIDMGFYYDTTGTLTTPTTDDLKFSVFALSAAQPQLNYYDFSSWTKNVTIMKKATAPTFTSLTSAAGLRAAAVTNLASGTANKITQLVAGNLVFFKTAGGKAGCMQINYINGSNEAKTSFANIDVKIEK